MYETVLQSFYFGDIELLLVITYHSDHLYEYCMTLSWILIHKYVSWIPHHISWTSGESKVAYSTLKMCWQMKDLNFVGYTYKNFEAVKGLRRSGTYYDSSITLWSYYLYVTYFFFSWVTSIRCFLSRPLLYDFLNSVTFLKNSNTFFGNDWLKNLINHAHMHPLRVELLTSFYLEERSI